MKTEQFLNIEIDRISPSGTNPRKHFDKKQMDELKNSIKEKGIIQPLLVRPFKEDAETYEIVAGERRYKAALEIGNLTVPVIARDLTDEQALEIQVIENLQREDIHPLEEAEGYQQLIDKNGADAQSIAEKIGKSPSYVHKRLVLLQLSAPVKEFYLEGNLNAEQAMLIARLPEEQQKNVFKTVQDTFKYRHTVSSNDLRGWIEAAYCNLKTAPFKLDEIALLPSAGACSVCPKRTGNNTELFDDVRLKDTCTDPHCFHEKIKAFISRKADQLREKNGEVVLITEEYGRKLSKDILRPHDYEMKGKGDKGAVAAVVVDGADIGKTKYVKVTKKESPPEDKNNSGSPGNLEAIEKQQLRRAISEKLARLIFVKAFPKLPQKLDDNFMREIAARVVSNASDIEEKLIAADALLEKMEQSHGDDAFVDALHEKGFSYDQIIIMSEFNLAIDPDYSGKIDPLSLKKWGELCGIDLVKVMKAEETLIKKEMALAKKEAKKKEKLTVETPAPDEQPKKPKGKFRKGTHKLPRDKK